MTGLPQGWARAPLGEVGQLHCGQSPSVPTVNHNGNGTPYVTGPEQWDGKQFRNPKWTTDPKRIVPTGCIFITVKGAGVGKTFPGVACAIGRDVYAFEPSSEMDYQFILRTIAFRATEIVENARGDIPGLSKSHIEDYAANLPPLPEQRRIVCKLDTLSARSTTARTHLTAIEKLVERYKSSVLISIFSDAATSGKMTTLDKVGKLVCGQSPASATVNRDGVGTSYCTGPEQWDGLSIHLDKWTTDPKRIVDEESIFITVKGSGVGTLFPGTRCAIGRDVYAYVPDQDRLDWRFAFWALRYEIASILINVKGLIPGLSKPDILDNPVFVPNIDEQREIVRRIETAFAKIDRLAAEAAKALKLLGHLDQRILAKAFAGDLVLQDPNDEPAETLLARIRAERSAAPKGRRKRSA